MTTLERTINTLINSNASWTVPTLVSAVLNLNTIVYLEIIPDDDYPCFENGEPDFKEITKQSFDIVNDLVTKILSES